MGLVVWGPLGSYATADGQDEDDKVEEVVEYDETAGQIVNYASRETPTRGRELGFWEQIFGTIGAVQLPRTDEATPDNPTGRR